MDEYTALVVHPDMVRNAEARAYLLAQVSECCGVYVVECLGEVAVPIAEWMKAHGLA